MCVWQCERNIQATLVHITDSWFPPFSPACMYSCLCVCTCIRSRFESDCVSLFASIILYVSPFCLSSNQPVFISHSLNILALLRRSLFSIFFAVTRTLSVHSFTHSLSLSFLYLCSLRSLISNRVTANSWSVSSTHSLYRVPRFNLHPVFLHLSLSFSQAVWRLCISVYMLE